MSLTLTPTQAPLHRGYKRTAIGVIPEDWTIRTLLTCLRSAPNYGINAAAIPFDDALPTYLRITDIGEDNQFRPSPRVSVRHPSAQTFFLNKGDLVFARTGASVGKSYLYNRDDGPLVFAGFLIRVSPNPRELQPGFLAYYVQSKRYWNWVATVSIRSGQPGINGQEYGTLQLPLPGPAEQCAIATALSDVDALLGGLDRLIAKKRDLKQAALQQLLTGQTRLPGFSAKWVERPLGQVGEIKSGGTPSTTQAHFWDGGVYWCTPTDITRLRGRKYLIDTARTISTVGLQFSSAEVIPPRSLIMTSRATIGECAINLVPVATNQGFKSIVTFADIDVEFLYYLMTTQKTSLVALCAGSTFLEIGKKQLSGYMIKLPKDRVEQEAIAAMLADMDAELAALETRRDKTQDLKQAMMQELLTGRTRLI